MSRFNFQVLEMRSSTPQAWLTMWAERYSTNAPSDKDKYDEQRYEQLIKNCASFTADDYLDIGKWKDAANSKDKWKANVASVAFLIWQQVAAESPRCPKDSEIRAFLDGWATREYTDTFKNKSVRKCFGLSRATTLLHFISGGRFPIYDSRVRTAFARLLGRPRFPYTLDAYLDSVLPSFSALADHCGTTDFRKVDKALFGYGAYDDPVLESSR